MPVMASELEWRSVTMATVWMVMVAPWDRLLSLDGSALVVPLSLVAPETTAMRYVVMASIWASTSVMMET